MLFIICIIFSLNNYQKDQQALCKFDLLGNITFKNDTIPVI